MAVIGASSLFGPPGGVRHHVFISYHHRSDQAFYETFSGTFHDTYESITDRSLERAVDSDNTDYVRWKISQNNIKGSSCTLVLVGAETWGRKYVDWEIEATLEMGHGLIGVQLPTLPVNSNGKVSVPDRLHDNIASGYALWETWANITSSLAQLDAYITAAKAKDNKLIVNSRDRRLRNA
jgi:hypothetical protein